LTKLLIWPIAGCFLLAAGAGALGAEPPGSDILNSGTYWRWHKASRAVVFVPKAADAAEVELFGGGRRKQTLSRRAAAALSPVPPKEGWAKPEFNDLAWPRTRTGRLGKAPFHGLDTGVVLLRAKFAVSDPAAIKGLRLSMKYRGGVVVYLNGEEVARTHLPAGDLTPATPAAPYPPETYVDSKGRVIPGHPSRRAKLAQTEKDLWDRLAKRDRALAPVTLPLRHLRKGLNVLAVEVHRSDLAPKARTWLPSTSRYAWQHALLGSLRLQAVGSGAAPNCRRSKGVQVWNLDRNACVEGLEYGDSNEPLRPVELTGARNGVVAGRVMVSSAEAVRGLKAVVSELKSAGGKEAIPAKNVKVLYGNWELHASPPAEVRVNTRLRRGDTPAEAALRRAAIESVWLSVQVSKAARPGDYTGTLTVSVDGQAPVPVPVRLHVANWVLPDPLRFRTTVALYQSPEALALSYKVASWSEAHWKLMDRSYELLGRVGNKLVILPLIRHTMYGNDEGMVTWIRNADGTFDHDFTVLERYLKLVRKHLGVPPFVAIQVWQTDGWRTRNDPPVTVTVRDRKTGGRVELRVPAYGTKESKAFWAPVLGGVRKRLAAEGMEASMCLGLLGDANPPKEVTRMFDEILSGARWMKSSHRPTRSPAPYPLAGGGQVVYNEHIYGVSPVGYDRAFPLSRHLSAPGVLYYRMLFGGGGTWAFRTFPEWSLYSRQRGFGHMGLDYWPGLIPSSGRYGSALFGRWPNAKPYPGVLMPPSLTYPGPQGAEPLVRFESLREGLQEAEAVLFLSDALDKHAASLGPALVATCERLLRDRYEAVTREPRFAYQTTFYQLNHRGWQDLSRRLFAAAATMQEKLEK